MVKFPLVDNLILPPWKGETGCPAPMVVLVGGESDMVELPVTCDGGWGPSIFSCLSRGWGLPFCQLFVVLTLFFVDILSVSPCLALVVLERMLGWSD